MFPIILNITKLCTIAEIQNIISESSEHRIKEILQDSDRKQQLVEYVLSNVNWRQVMVKNLTEMPKDPACIVTKFPVKEKKVIQQLLRKGISKIINKISEDKTLELKHKI